MGTTISGQAARTLGAEAGIGESRTIASLLWRLEHGEALLDSHSVVVCDEAGLTDDPNMLRLLAATEAAGSKLIIVGDHRQLGAVGPGGSLQALVASHTGSVHALRENVRQANPDERTMLAHLRAGNVEQAVNWYADHGRIGTATDREQALERTVTPWGPTRSALTNSPSDTPRLFIEARGQPSIPPIYSPTAAGESSETSP